MTSPGTGRPDRADLVTVRPEALAALGAELAALAAELADDADRSRSAAVSLPPALGGAEGWTAGAAATAWAALHDLLAGRTRAVADTLAAAVDAYRAQDGALAADVSDRRGPR